MEKSPEAFRTIREVADAMDLPQHVLRFWETRFPQIKPMKRAGGRRYYRPDDVERLKLIRRLLYDEGFTIKGVQKLFKEQGAHNLMADGFDARLPFELADAPSPADPDEFSASAPEAATLEAEPGLAPEPEAPPLQTGPRFTPEDLDRLRAALDEVKEAQRILAQALPRKG